MSTARLVAAVAALALSSCSNVVWVTAKKSPDLTTGKQDGIPFYTKVEKFHRTTVYDVTWLQATLTVDRKVSQEKSGKEGDQTGRKEVFVRLAPLTDLAVLDDFARRIVDATGTDVGTADAFIREFVQRPNFNPDTATPGPAIKHSVDSEWVVDSSRTYFLNAPLPWFGTGNLTQELNDNGTLAKATSNPEQKLAEGLSQLLPIKEFLTSRFSSAAAAAPAAVKAAIAQDAIKYFALDGSKQPLQGVNEVWILSLAVEQKGYRYTLTDTPSTTPPEGAIPIPFGDIALKKALYTRTDLPAPKDKEDKKDSGNQIGIAGTITLPKDSTAAAAKSATDAKQDTKKK
ncbi:MAG: hypothetical protein JSS86_00650 [Cyanobacteria bacterium SZAS LIN-2]|nr:hypothetical protein [Cyanobacteria bacterium SZAS LIN-2]